MKINKCPKCGREPSVFSKATITKELRMENVRVEAECYDCGLHTGSCNTHDEAIEKWNELTKVGNE